MHPPTHAGVLAVEAIARKYIAPEREVRVVPTINKDVICWGHHYALVVLPQMASQGLGRFLGEVGHAQLRRKNHKGGFREVFWTFNKGNNPLMATLFASTNSLFRIFLAEGSGLNGLIPVPARNSFLSGLG